MQVTLGQFWAPDSRGREGWLFSNPWEAVHHVNQLELASWRMRCGRKPTALSQPTPKHIRKLVSPQLTTDRRVSSAQDQKHHQLINRFVNKTKMSVILSHWVGASCEISNWEVPWSIWILLAFPQIEMPCYYDLMSRACSLRNEQSKQNRNIHPPIFCLTISLFKASLLTVMVASFRACVLLSTTRSLIFIFTMQQEQEVTLEEFRPLL